MGRLTFFDRLFNRKAMTEQVFYRALEYGGKYVMMPDDPEKYITDALLFNPDVAAVINYTKKVASDVPWILKKGEDVVDSHPILTTWRRPNPVIRGNLMVQQAIEHYMSTGNAYLYGIGPETGEYAGTFKELYNLPYDIQIERGDKNQYIAGYVTRDFRAKYPVEKVMHWKTTNPDGDGFYGTSPLRSARPVIQQSNDAYKANAMALQNNGARGILTRKDLAQAGPEEATKLKAKFKEEYGGGDKWNSLVITGGDYQWVPFGLSPVDLALLEAQIRSRQAICNVYGFPSELLNDKESSTYNNILIKMRQLYTNVVMPMMEDFADLINEWWIAKYGPEWSFRPDWSQVDELQDNRTEQATWLSAAWWIKGTDKQRIMGLSEDPEMDQYFIPMGLIPNIPDINMSTEDATKAYKI